MGLLYLWAYFTKTNWLIDYILHVISSEISNVGMSVSPLVVRNTVLYRVIGGLSFKSSVQVISEFLEPIDRFEGFLAPCNLVDVTNVLRNPLLLS